MTVSEFIEHNRLLNQQLDQRVAALESVPLDVLNRPTPGHWSPLGCIDHLNKAGAAYLPLIQGVLHSAPALEGDPEVKFGRIAGKIYKMVGPDAPDTVPVPKPALPTEGNLTLDTIAEYRRQIQETQKLLDLLQSKDGTVLLRSPLSSLIKLTAYEALAIIGHHGDRHVGQAETKIRQPE